MPRVDDVLAGLKFQTGKGRALSRCIGIDVGGTTTTVCIGDDRRQILHMSGQFPTLSQQGPQATIHAIVENILQGLDGIGSSMADVPSVALATPGTSTLDGVLLKTPNLVADLWDRFPIRLELEKALRRHNVQVNVHYIGDGQAAALGEYSVRTQSVRGDQLPVSGPPEDFDSLFMVTVGTGLGGGEVRSGNVIRGTQGRAGHAGHILLPHYAFRYEHDRQLLVGNALCTLESAASLTGLTHQLGYRLSLEQWKTHPLNSAPGTIRDKAKQLRELAAQRDLLALELFEDQARALGIGLLNVNYVGDYDLLVIGGGVCDLAPALRDRYRQHAQESYSQYALEGFKSDVRIEFSICGDNSSVIGALVHAYTMKSAD